ncbi:MAG TPA: molybdenum cofactor biosynthesis protein MoaE [Rubricoccaceae bacterium]|jgi:molybdopterin synthase catalytic subunit
MSFALSDVSLDATACRAALLAAAPSGASGGIVTFEGVVRDHADGRAVQALEYHAYAALARREGARITGEAQDRFRVEAVHVVHRTGHLSLGETAVWVGAAAAHRDAAFEACRWTLDAVKARVPIWKREHYADGPAEWVGAPEVEGLASHRSDP